MDTLLGFVIIGAITYWWIRRRKAKKESQGSLKVTVQESDTGDALKSGRAKLPGKKWVCTRCNREFSISVDPKTVPRMWWIPSNNDKGGSPWACPDCGTYAYTVPRD
jgi:DNA-directed RNA polymerase subunit RPC12/RpoP